MNKKYPENSQGLRQAKSIGPHLSWRQQFTNKIYGTLNVFSFMITCPMEVSLYYIYNVLHQNPREETHDQRMKEIVQTKDKSNLWRCIMSEKCLHIGFAKLREQLFLQAPIRMHDEHFKEKFLSTFDIEIKPGKESECCWYTYFVAQWRLGLFRWEDFKTWNSFYVSNL